MRIGIMQGRMVPPIRGIQAFPRDNWREEFPNAAEAGLTLIEWIYDEFSADMNPIMTDEGIAEIKAISAKTSVAIDTVCADYFMDWPLLKCSTEEQAQRLTVLMKLIEQTKKLGAKHITLPFVDASAMNSAEEENAFIKLMNETILPTAEKSGLEIHLETSLPPEGVARVLAQIPSKLFWINYDAGNSASLGYKPADEFAAYGARIGSFHIKDRVLGSTTVPLGTGNTDFESLARGLIDSGYRRPYVLQVARGEAGDEIAWARKNREFWEALLAKHGSRA